MKPTEIKLKYYLSDSCTCDSLHLSIRLQQGQTTKHRPSSFIGQLPSLKQGAVLPAKTVESIMTCTIGLR